VWSVGLWVTKYAHWFLGFVPWLLFAFSFWPQSFDLPYAVYYLISVTFCGQVARLLVTALLCRLYGPLYPGICERYSFEHYRIEAKQNLCDFRAFPFGGTLLFNPILWLFGYKIDFFSCENDVPIDSIADLHSVGAGAFTTAGHYTRPITMTPEHAIAERTHIGAHSLVGNVAVVGPGIMKDNLLVGVTPPPPL